MDYSALIGRKVVHVGMKGYGEGIIIAANPTYITLLTLKNNI